MNYSKVREDEHLVRDNDSNALINTNLNEYRNYIELRKVKERENRRIEQIESEMIIIKNDLNEIKNLLREFCQ
jgi:heterodisulfide reductase subunit C